MLTGFDSPPSRVKLSLGEVFAIQISCRWGKRKWQGNRAGLGEGAGERVEAEVAEADYRQLASVAKLSLHMALLMLLLILLLILLVGITVFSLRFEYF